MAKRSFLIPASPLPGAMVPKVALALTFTAVGCSAFDPLLGVWTLEEAPMELSSSSSSYYGCDVTYALDVQLEFDDKDGEDYEGEMEFEYSVEIRCDGESDSYSYSQSYDAEAERKDRKEYEIKIDDWDVEFECEIDGDEMDCEDDKGDDYLFVKD